MSDLLEAAKAVVEKVGKADVLFEPVFLSQEQWDSETNRLELAREALDDLADAVQVAEKSDVEQFRAFLEDAVYAFPQADWNMDLPPGVMDVEADINGGDLVEWYGTWREKVRKALGITERMRPEEGNV